ncbi:Bidirectional sugar transporter sweet1 [Stylosanthes scabra]|uniref:Bidirectional sugar transporter SWEET n=1 Tax=Stylosanthes scabra TaxID=79078 RepID=A0ABU6ZPA7_9FABA|nr:Bidirectional sugar transporter sweet1 [Stylosanthes scabra]
MFCISSSGLVNSSLVAGNASGLFLFLAPTITFKRIIENKSTEQFSGVPYPMTLLNCLLSAWYGLPFISPHNILVTVINGAGAVIEIAYVIIFLSYAPKNERNKVLGLVSFVVIVFTSVVLISLLALEGDHRRILCGLVAAFFSIVMYGSPLSIMKMVIKTKSVEYMPFFLSLFVFICGTSWFIYGLLGHDPYIATPNGLGSLLGAVQLILYFIYRGNKGSDTTENKSDTKPTEAETIAAENTMEMGIAKATSSSLPQQ